MRSRSLLLALALLLPLGAVGCGSKGHHHIERHREVSLSFVVTDSDGYAWKDVIVRLDEAWNEWNDCICQGIDPYAEQLTDENGEVYFDSADVARSDLGFQRHKPTYGLVSRHGVLPNSFSYDHCGPLARTAEDCALIMNAIAGFDARDPASARGRETDFSAGIGASIKGMRIGVIRHFWETDAKLHAELPGAMDNALAVLRSLGAELEDVQLRPLQHYQDVKVVMAEAELFSIHLEALRQRVADFGQDFRARALGACLFTAEDIVCASRCRRAIATEMESHYDRFDAFVTANTSPAPRIDRHNNLSFWQSPSLTVPFNCTGGPALALPCGFTENGLPLSLQFAGRPFEDAKIFQIGHAFERELGIWQQRPDLISGETPAEVAPEAWRPDVSQITPAIRARAEAAAQAAGLNLPPAIFDELLAVAPWALEMAKRLPRKHRQYDEVASIFVP